MAAASSDCKCTGNDNCQGETKRLSKARLSMLSAELDIHRLPVGWRVSFQANVPGDLLPPSLAHAEPQLCAGSPVASVAVHDDVLHHEWCHWPICLWLDLAQRRRDSTCSSASSSSPSLATILATYSPILNPLPQWLMDLAKQVQFRALELGLGLGRAHTRGGHWPSRANDS